MYCSSDFCNDVQSLVFKLRNAAWNSELDSDSMARHPMLELSILSRRTEPPFFTPGIPSLCFSRQSGLWIVQTRMAGSILEMWESWRIWDAWRSSTESSGDPPSPQIPNFNCLFRELHFSVFALSAGVFLSLSNCFCALLSSVCLLKVIWWSSMSFSTRRALPIGLCP